MNKRTTHHTIGEGANAETWHRSEWVTPGADPTEVVEWKHGDITITQFQNVFKVEGPINKSEYDIEKAYNALEDIYYEQEFMGRDEDAYRGYTRESR